MTLAILVAIVTLAVLALFELEYQIRRWREERR